MNLCNLGTNEEAVADNSWLSFQSELLNNEDGNYYSYTDIDNQIQIPNVSWYYEVVTFIVWFKVDWKQCYAKYLFRILKFSSKKDMCEPTHQTVWHNTSL